MFPRAFFARCRNLLRRRRVLAAFDEEMAFHLEELARDYERRGLAPAAARAAARREFGNTVQPREALHEQSGWPVLEDFGRDLSLAARGLARRPVLAIGAGAILALALGAATTLVALVDAIYLRPLPVPRAGELRVVREGDGSILLCSAPTARRLAALLPPGAALAAHSADQMMTVQRGSEPAERVRAQLVEGGFFHALELSPVAGRVIAAADDLTGDGANVAVVGEGWARSRFGSAAAAVGAEMRVNRHPVRIVGVVSQEFGGLAAGSQVILWLPAALQPAVTVSSNVRSVASDDRPNQPDWNREERVDWMQLVLRVPPDGDAAILPLLLRASQPERDDILAAVDDPEMRARLLRPVLTLDAAAAGYSSFRSAFGRTSRLLGGIVGALLLLAAANVSNLLLVRALSRRREIGVRLALGARGLRVSRLMVAESALLGLVGACLGVVLALWLVPVAGRFLAPGQELVFRAVSWRSLGALAALASLAVGLCAWAPAAWIARLDPLVAIAGRSSAHRSPLRVGRLLVAVQLALAVVVVTVAVTLGGELRRTLGRDPGFARSVLTATFDAASAGFGDQAAAEGLVRRLEARARAVPGVEEVGFASSGILAGSRSRSGIHARGEARVSFDPGMQNDGVTAGYFAAVGMTLLQGRTFEPTDTAEAEHVAVVTAGFAQKMFGTIDVLGRRFGYDAEPGDDDWTIVGVVSDANVNRVGEEAPPMFFAPAAEAFRPPQFLAVRTASRAGIVSKMLREALAAEEPSLVWSRWQTLEDRIDDDVRGERTMSWLVGSLAGVALLLAAVGIGVNLAHLVTLHRREIAVRMALGADRRRIVREVLFDAWRLAAAGGGAGLLLVLVLPRLPFASTLVPVHPDLGAAGAALVFGLGAATLGGWQPARQAAGIDPQANLKAD